MIWDKWIFFLFTFYFCLHPSGSLTFVRRNDNYHEMQKQNNDDFASDNLSNLHEKAHYASNMPPASHVISVEQSKKSSLKSNSQDLQTQQNSKPIFIRKEQLNSENNRPKRDESVIKAPVDGTDSTMKFVKFETGETIRLKCHIPKGPYLVMWNKIGVDYPLSIGTRPFVPDNRIHIRFKAPDKWRLTITNAKLSDSGVYTCTTSASKTNHASQYQSVEQTVQNYSSASGLGTTTNVSTNEIHSNKQTEAHWNTDRGEENVRPKIPQNSDYYVTVVEPNPNDRFQVDAPATDRVTKQNKSIVVTGPKIVFYGTPLELICRASFASAEAKLNPTISLEWYHRGVRRRESPTRSGGVYISERWLDSNLLESRLLIAWASEADAGQWICLDRSNFLSHNNRGNQYSGYPHLKSDREQPSNSVHLSANAYDMNSKHLPARNRPISSFMSSPLVQSYDQDGLFDRIEVEIVDLPDPTAEPPVDSFPNSMPAFLTNSHNKLSNSGRTSHLYGKRETSNILRSSASGKGQLAMAMGSSNFQISRKTSYLLMGALLCLFWVLNQSEC